jgi:hypothetical protein
MTALRQIFCPPCRWSEFSTLAGLSRAWLARNEDKFEISTSRCLSRLEKRRGEFSVPLPTKSRWAVCQHLRRTTLSPDARLPRAPYDIYLMFYQLLDKIRPLAINSVKGILLVFSKTYLLYLCSTSSLALQRVIPPLTLAKSPFVSRWVQYSSSNSY